MISVDQWRAVIGCFSPRRKKQKLKLSTITISNRQCVSIGVRAVILISLCIILSGDIETNPGPDYDQILNELKEIRKDNKQHFKELREDISCLKAEINTMKGKVDQAILDIDHIYDECYGEIQSLRSSVKQLEKNVENQERYSRRDNLIFHDIPCDENETSVTTREKLIDILNKNVTDKTWTNNDFVRVHRLKSKQGTTSPIIARLVRTEDKFLILNARQKLRDSSYGVANDLTPMQRHELHTLRQEGRKGYYKGGRLIVDQSSNGLNPNNSSQTTNEGTAGGERNFQFGSGRGFPTRGRYTRRPFGWRNSGRGRGGYSSRQHDGNINNSQV